LEDYEGFPSFILTIFDSLSRFLNLEDEITFLSFNDAQNLQYVPRDIAKTPILDDRDQKETQKEESRKDPISPRQDNSKLSSKSQMVKAVISPTRFNCASYESDSGRVWVKCDEFVSSVRDLMPDAVFSMAVETAIEDDKGKETSVRRTVNWAETILLNLNSLWVESVVNFSFFSLHMPSLLCFFLFTQPRPHFFAVIVGENEKLQELCLSEVFIFF
jgi:hypothetical protein